MSKDRALKTEAYVHIGDGLVNTDDLDREQRRRLATWLKSTYLNTLFQGKAQFFERGGTGDRKGADRPL